MVPYYIIWASFAFNSCMIMKISCILIFIIIIIVIFANGLLIFQDTYRIYYIIRR